VPCYPSGAKRAVRWLLFISLFACGASETKLVVDPCAPHGHVHRERAGDWCHCNRGYRAAFDGLRCENDPSFTGRTTVDLGASNQRACWHAVNGPFAEVQAPTVDSFLTVYRWSNAGAKPSVMFRSSASAAHVLTTQRNVNLQITEVTSEGTREVPILVTRAITPCTGLAQQFGFELAARAQYRLAFETTEASPLTFIIDGNE
jgi:hypothetical protein